MVFATACVSILEPPAKEWLQHLKHSHAHLAIWMLFFESVKELNLQYPYLISMCTRINESKQEYADCYVSIQLIHKNKS